MPRLDVDWEGVHFSAAALFTNRRGDGLLSGEVSVGGTTLAGNLPVQTSIDLEVLTTAVTWDMIPSDWYEFGLGFGLHLVDFDTSIQDVATGEIARTKELFPVPVIVARFNFKDWPLGAGLSIGKLDLGLPGLDLETFDVDAFVEWRAFGTGERETGYLVLGYRRLNLAAEYDDADRRGRWPNSIYER